jgi:DNA-binding NarL/FixJ family response regulator
VPAPRAPQHQPRLVGRRRELAQIGRLLDRRAADATGLLQIAGESGIGKTRLLSWTASRAAEEGALALVGRAAEFEHDEPYGAFHDALDETLAGLPRGRLDGLEEEHVRELTATFPALARPVGAAAPAGEDAERPTGVGLDRYRLHRAVARLLELLADDHGVLLAIDDLHWADRASIELLLSLLRRPPSAPLLVVVAFRSRQLEARTAAALQQAQRGCDGELIDLAPLSAEEASAFVPPSLSTAVAERLYDDSGGNPFYLEELVRAALSGQPAPGGAEEPRRVPPTITAVIAGEFDRLSEGARSLLEAASVVGDPFEPELAGEIVGMDEASALAALDELLDRELVQLADVAGRCSFRHPIVRRAVYESAKGGWRRNAHARAAAVLGERGAPAAARARHVERSAGFGDLEAIDVLCQAGYASVARAPAAAATWFRAALRLLPDQADSDARVNLMLATAASLGSAGDLGDSRDVFQEVLAVLPATALRTGAVMAAALVEHLLGNHDQAQSLLLGALPGLDEDTAEAAELKLEIADGCFFSADWTGMRYWAQRALGAGDVAPIISAGIGAALALAEYGLGDTEAARDAAADAAAIADGLSDADWASRLQSICLLGWCEYCIGRFDGAELHMRRALAVSHTTGQEHLSAAMLVIAAMSNLAMGRLAAAREQADTAIDTSMLSANYLFLTWAQTARCMVEIECVGPSAAARFGRDAVETGVRSRSAWSSVATMYLAEVWLESGEPERFRKELFGGESTPRLPPFPFYAVHAYELLTRGELELGLPDAAERWADQAMELAVGIGLPGPIAQARRARAALELGTGQFAAAAESALASAEEAEAAGQAIHAARSRLLAGIALRRLGEEPTALEQVRRAEEVFAAHGAERHRDQAARELRQLGVHAVAARGPANADGGLGGLSRRELTIARLVHDGRTNRQIAEELSISVKTVENHMTKIFRELQISSRAQLATLVERARGVAA